MIPTKWGKHRLVVMRWIVLMFPTMLGAVVELVVRYALTAKEAQPAKSSFQPVEYRIHFRFCFRGAATVDTTVIRQPDGNQGRLWDSFRLGGTEGPRWRIDYVVPDGMRVAPRPLWARRVPRNRTLLLLASFSW